MNIQKIKPARSKKGEFAKTNKTNKKQLRIDFHDCCGYCGDNNKYCGGHNYFHVEHFAPKEKFPQLSTNYDNLIYSCPYCNLSKSDKWVGKTAKQALVEGIGFIDPCSDYYDKCLYRKDNGELAYFEYSTEGRYIYENLKFYLERHRYCYNMERLYETAQNIKRSLDEKKLYGIELSSKDKQKYEIYKEVSAMFMDEFIEFTS